MKAVVMVYVSVPLVLEFDKAPTSNTLHEVALANFLEHPAVQGNAEIRELEPFVDKVEIMETVR